MEIISKQYQQQLQSKYNNGFIPSSISKNKVSLEDEFLQKITGILDEKLEDPDFSIADLCQEVHLSHTQVYRKIKALTGLTPSLFIRSYRLQKGMELLLSSNESVSEIAYRVGFNDPNYFSRTFSEKFGKTPTAIRKE